MSRKLRSKIKTSKKLKTKSKFSSLIKKDIGNSLFYRINQNVKNILTNSLPFPNVYNEVKNTDPIQLKKERIHHVTQLKDPSLIKKLYLHPFKISSSKKSNIGLVEYIGYNFINGHLTKADNGISIGTWINNDSDKCTMPLVNIYKSKLTINKITIENIRFGTAIKCPANSDIIRSMLQKFVGKKIIDLSLLSFCSGLCSVTSSLFDHGPGLLKKINETIKYEPIIIKTEENLNNQNFSTVFLPMTSGKSYGIVSVNEPTEIYKLNKSIIDEKVITMISLLDLTDLYKSIIKMFIYYFIHLKKEYVIAIHCKSAKDRTSIVDALFKSVMTVMSEISLKNQQINDICEEIIEDVEKWFIEYLKIGLIITYYSTGLYGLKIKRSAILDDLKRILGDKYNFYLGLQEFMKE